MSFDALTSLVQSAQGVGPSPLLVWMVPLLPVFGFIFQVFIGRRLPKPVVSFVSCGVVLMSCLISWYLFFVVRKSGPVEANIGRWIHIPGFEKGWLSVIADHRLVVDQLTCVMILVVTNIGFLIHVYSIGYMAEEKRYARYFSYLNLFTGFMLILVMASNLLLMFVGWEGVGLCSYLLIGFWYEKKENASAGMKAFIVNRIGDLAFTIGVLMLFVYLGRTFGVWTVDFDEMSKVIAANKGAVDLGLCTIISILLFIGATGKSAQVPLFVWLPDAMAGPTPVSALIHAATMVTAGVYMVARMNFLFSLSPTAMAVVATVGAVTALFAGTIGFAQNDIKKVLAYSTVSQLGFMFMGVGVGAFAAGIFHLFTHAFFKACLFLGSGSVIHGMGHEQDIRKMGGLKSKMPITFWTFLIASVAICGVPPLAGFFSKDEILFRTWEGTAFKGFEWWGKGLWFLGAVAAAGTAFYMTRLVIKTFYGRPMWAKPAAFSGGGKDLPDGMDEEEKKKEEAKKPKEGQSPDGFPAWMEEDDTVNPLDADESMLDMGAIGKKPHASHEDHSHASDLPQDESLLDMPKIGKVPAHDPHAVPAHDSGHGHGAHEAGEPHESPWSMLIALVILAAGSVVVGFFGIPPALKGHDAFGTFLSPVVGQMSHEVHAIEYILMAISVLLALGGIGAAIYVYHIRKGVPAQDFATNNKELYQLVADKYRVDELYDKTIVQPLLNLNEGTCRFDNEVVDGAVNGAAWVGKAVAKGTGLVDNEVVDAAVNAAAMGTQAIGRKIRRVQTGNIKEYLTFALVGGLFVIAAFCLYLTWPKIF